MIVAVKVVVEFFSTVAFALSSTTESIGTSVTFTVTVPLISGFALLVIVTTAWPSAFAVTIPFSSTLATSALSEANVTVLSDVVSEGFNVYFTSAVWFFTRSITSFSGVILSSGASTVTLHVAVKLPTFAVITALPVFTAVTFPSPSTVATVLSEELQLTVLSSVVFSGS